MDRITCYIAAPFTNRRAVRKLIKALKKSRFDPISTWQLQNKEHKSLDDAAVQRAMIDLQEIYQAKAIIVLSSNRKIRGGFLYESGYAHALQKQIFLIGPPRVIFHSLIREDHCFKNVKEFIRFAQDSKKSVNYKSTIN